jgi:hypothetical protein
MLYHVKDSGTCNAVLSYSGTFWAKIYLPSLVPRKKWKAEQPNLAVGDFVLIIDPNQPRGQWKIGHIIQTFPGEDGLVRVAKIQTVTGVYSMVIHRLYACWNAHPTSVHQPGDAF